MYERMLSEVRENIEHLTAMTANVEKLPELRGFHYGYVHESYLSGNFPHDPALMKEHQAALEAAGWKFKYEFRSPEDGTLRRDFYGPCQLSLFYYPKMEGATCKLNVIGYEQKPIVEVVCMEA